MGCTGSKKQATAPAGTKEDTIITPAAEPKPAESATPAAAPPALSVNIVSAHGLRPADSSGKKSDVFVEVCIEGKPASKIETAVVTGQAAKRPGAEEGEKDSVEVELNFTAELPDFVEGDKVVFTVKDKDTMLSDTLGKAVVADGKFGGRLDLEGAGDGFKAFLMVQLGGGAGLSGALADMGAAVAEAKQKLAAAADLAASGDPDKMVEAAAAAGSAIAEAATDMKDVAMEGLQEVEGTVCCLCGEEPKKQAK